MTPIKDYPLDEVIWLPEYEPVPDDPEEAIQYLAQWDYGEYGCDPILLSDLYTLHGHIYVVSEYVLFRSYCGDHALYRCCTRID